MSNFTFSCIHTATEAGQQTPEQVWHDGTRGAAWQRPYRQSRASGRRSCHLHTSTELSDCLSALIMGDKANINGDASSSLWETIKEVPRLLEDVLRLTGEELIEIFDKVSKPAADELPPLEIVDRQSDRQSQESLDDIVGRLRREKVAVNREKASYDPRQVNVHKLLDRMLKEKALDKAGWEVFPTQIHSPADKVGADYLLVNTKTGALHLLDATSNPNKDAPFIRKDGVILFENRWFDQSGALKTDENVEAKEFQTRLGKQLVDLTRSNSLLRLGQTPFPDITDTELDSAKQQVDRLIEWLKQQAQSHEPRSYERLLLDDYAFRLETGAKKFLEISFKERGDPVFDRRTREAAKSAILEYIFKQLKKPGSRDLSPETSDVYLNKGHLKLRTSSGEFIDGGEVLKVIDAARSELLALDPKRAKINLENARAAIAKAANDVQREKAVGEFAKAYNDQRILTRLEKAGLTPLKFANLLIGYRNQIASGGQVGGGRAEIVDNLLRILRTRSEDSLLGRNDKLPEPSGRGEKVSNGPQDRARERLEPMLKESRQVWQDNFQSGRLNGQYSEDVHLALLEIQKDASWGEAEWKEFGQLVDGYAKHDPAAIERVHRAFENTSDTTPRSTSNGRPQGGSGEKRPGHAESVKRPQSSSNGNGSNGSRAASAMEETSEFFDSQDTTSRDQRSLRTETQRGANGVEIITDRTGSADVAKILEKYDKDEVFERFLERRAAEAKEESERRKLQEELENYRRLSPAERTRVREAVVGEAVERGKSNGRGGSIAGKVLSVGGTVIAVGMLVDLLVGEAHASDRSSGRSANPEFRQ